MQCNLKHALTIYLFVYTSEPATGRAECFPSGRFFQVRHCPKQGKHFAFVADWHKTSPELRLANDQC